MGDLIEELAKEFRNSIPDEVLGKKLAAKYITILNEIVKKFKEKNYEDSEIENSLKTISKEWINLELEEKQRRLMIDKNFGKIMEISYQVYNMAISVLTNKEIKRDFEIAEKIEELENLLKNVEPYNKEEAKTLVSEGILDLKFIENPNTHIVSLRLGHIKYSDKEEER